MLSWLGNALSALMGAKHQRVDAEPQPPAEVKQVVANSLRLVKDRNLPRATELLAMSFLPAHDLGSFPTLSRDMYKLVRAYFAQLRSFTLQDVPTYEMRDVVFLWAKLDDDEPHRTAVSLLQHCRQLRTLDLSASFISDKWKQLQEHIAEVVGFNKDSLTAFKSGRTSPLVLVALAECRRLVEFNDALLAVKLYDSDWHKERLQPRQRQLYEQKAYGQFVWQILEANRQSLTRLDLGVAEETGFFGLGPASPPQLNLTWLAVVFTAGTCSGVTSCFSRVPHLALLRRSAAARAQALARHTRRRPGPREKRLREHAGVPGPARQSASSQDSATPSASSWAA
jgi:hypothetical protein